MILSRASRSAGRLAPLSGALISFLSSPGAIQSQSSTVHMSSVGASSPGTPLSWEALDKLCTYTYDPVIGPTNAHSRLRLFGQSESSVRVTLYRDHHAWCPYCQKIWLYLEEKRIPYRVAKVTMFCYGDKERWYLQKVPSGMLPALELGWQHCHGERRHPDGS